MPRSWTRRRYHAIIAVKNQHEPVPCPTEVVNVSNFSSLNHDLIIEMGLSHTTSNCAPVSAAPSARAHKELARRVNPRPAPVKTKRKTALILTEQIMNKTFMHAAEIPKNPSPRSKAALCE
jgi:hypothetical protein